MSPLVIVYNETLCREHFAKKFSKANIWRHISNILVVIISLALSFTSQGFWKKTNTYLEQPKVHFNQECMFLLISKDDYLYWNPVKVTESNNKENLDKLLIPVIESHYIDQNLDTKSDEIFINVKLTKPENKKNFEVQSVFYMFEFDILLEYRAQIKLKGQIIGWSNRIGPQTNPLYRFEIMGSFKLQQKKPLPSFGIIDLTSMKNKTDELKFDTNFYFPREIQLQNFEQNITIKLVNKIEYWYPGQNNILPTFKIDFRMQIPEQVLIYHTNMFELIKWAWIQYLAIWIVVRFIFGKFDDFFYKNQIFETIVWNEKWKIN